MTTPILQLDSVEAHYGAIRALKNISLEVHGGEIVTLIGANGAGKSTTLRAINGFVRPSAGEIRLDGQLISELPPHAVARLGVAHCLEGRRMFPRMTVEENLELGAYRHADGEEVAAHVADVFAMFPRLRERRDQAAGTLSGGEQQMCALGRALMTRPRVLMLDEPSMGLAPMVVEQMFQAIKDINAGGTTVLLVEQNAVMALEIADRAYVIETGAIVLEGPARTLMENEDVRRAYLGDA
ncbi:MAG: transporter related protein [Solirubrobacterales bacterium]|jgi:branched-chain amino acid transport system ATP-binding protein|nr:transporter related protein [Solirubrobacterales bacterium]